MSKNNPKCPKHIAGRAGESARNNGARSHDDDDRAKATLPWGKFAKEHPNDFQNPLPGFGNCYGCGKKGVWNIEQCEAEACKATVKKYKQSAAKRVPGEIRSIQLRNKDSTPTAVDPGICPEPNKAVHFEAHRVGTSFEHLPLVVEINGVEMTRDNAIRMLFKCE